MPTVVTNIQRTRLSGFAVLESHDVASAHEARGRLGLMNAYRRPIHRPASSAGSAVTVEVGRGESRMIHVAVEPCQPRDILVVKPGSSQGGHLVEVLATSWTGRGR